MKKFETALIVEKRCFAANCRNERSKKGRVENASSFQINLQRSSDFCYLCFLPLASQVKNTGTKIVAMKVAAIMPPKTPVPIEWRA